MLVPRPKEWSRMTLATAWATGRWKVTMEPTDVDFQRCVTYIKQKVDCITRVWVSTMSPAFQVNCITKQFCWPKWAIHGPRRPVGDSGPYLSENLLALRTGDALAQLSFPVSELTDQ